MSSRESASLPCFRSCCSQKYAMMKPSRKMIPYHLICRGPSWRRTGSREEVNMKEEGRIRYKRIALCGQRAAGERAEIAQLLDTSILLAANNPRRIAPDRVPAAPGRVPVAVVVFDKLE